MWTDDPVADAQRHYEEQEKDNLPICECCGRTITDDWHFYYNDQCICPACEESIRDTIWEDIKDQYIEEADW